MKDAPLIDVFENTDFNPELMLPGVFLDPCLDFVTNMDELGDNIMVPDMLQHVANSVFYSQNLVANNDKSIENLSTNDCLQQVDHKQVNNQLQHIHQEEIPVAHTSTFKISKVHAAVEKNIGKLHYDSFDNELTKQISTSGSMPKGIQTAQLPAPQQQQHLTTIGIQRQQQSCKCEFCEYLQANRISLTGDHSFQCEFCGEGFSSQISFNQHRCGSTDIHCFRCETCNREYGSSRPLLGTYEHHNKCDLCIRSNGQTQTQEQSVYDNTQITGKAAPKANMTTITEHSKSSVRSGEIFQLPTVADGASVSTAFLATTLIPPDASTGHTNNVVITNAQCTADDSLNHQELNDIHSFESDSEGIQDFFTRVENDVSNSTRVMGSANERACSALVGTPFPEPGQHIFQSSKTYFVLGNVEQIQQPQHSRTLMHNSTINSHHTSHSSQHLQMPTVAVAQQHQPIQNFMQHDRSCSLQPGENEVTSLQQYDYEDYSSMSEDEAIVPIEPYAKSPNHDQAKTELPIQETIVDTSTNSVQRGTLENGLLPMKNNSTDRLLGNIPRHEYMRQRHQEEELQKQNKRDANATSECSACDEDGKCDSSSSLGSFPISVESIQQQSESPALSMTNCSIERPYKCNICERSYRNQKNLKSHLKVHEGIRAYQCEICGKNFSGSSYLVIHRRRHTGERPFKCGTCGKAFVDSRALAVHTRLHSGERLKCEKCEKTFSSVSALTVHNRLHTGIHPYKCELCDKTFPQYNNLKHHMKKHYGSYESSEKQSLQASGDSFSGDSSPFFSSGIPSSSNSIVVMEKTNQRQHAVEHMVASSTTSPHLGYKCHICSRLHKSSDDLQEHINQHRKDRPNQCEFCSKVFPRSSHLIIHRRRHTGERPFKCKYCDKAFVDSRALSVHTRLHTGERVKCETCGKTFASSSGLIVHRRIHTGVHPYKCDYCEKSFAQSTALKYHLKKHDITMLPTTTSNCTSVSIIPSKDKLGLVSSLALPGANNSTESNYRHKCHLCDKFFRSSEYLVRHRRTHNGERPYQCETCEKNFSTMSYLVIHRRRHTSERPYKCTSCEKAFVDSRALQEHVRLHTGDRVRCEICQKTYSSISNLIVHRRIHSGVHPFECDTCGKSFAQKNALKYHLKKHVTQQ